MIQAMTIRGFLHELESNFGDFSLTTSKKTVQGKPVCTAKLTVFTNKGEPIEAYAIKSTEFEATLSVVRAIEAKVALGETAKMSSTTTVTSAGGETTTYTEPEACCELCGCGSGVPECECDCEDEGTTFDDALENADQSLDKLSTAAEALAKAATSIQEAVEGLSEAIDDMDANR